MENALKDKSIIKTKQLADQENRRIETIQLQLSYTNYLAEIESKYADLKDIAANRDQHTLDSQLEARKQLGLISEENYIQEKLSLDLISEKLSRNTEQRKLDENRGRETRGFEARQEDISGMTNTKQQSIEQSRLNAEILASVTYYNAQTDSVNANSVARETALNLTSQTNEILREQASILESLSEIFGSLGTKMSKAFTGVGTAIQKQASIEKKYADDKKDKTKDQSKVENEYTKSTIENNIKALNSAKHLFSEKTAAYKVLDGVEKAYHITKVIMDGIELYNEYAKAAAKIATAEAAVASVPLNAAADTANAASAAATTPISIAAGAARMFSQLGVFGFVAVGAMVALMAGLMGGGKGSVSIPGGISAADRQETQGTGTSWVNGKKVENGGGVFGDTTAKSKTIENSKVDCHFTK